MVLRLILSSSHQLIEKEFRNTINLSIEKNFNISPGKSTIIATSNMGSFHQMDWGIPRGPNNIHTVHSKRILTSYHYRSAIRSTRCLIPVNCIAVKRKEKWSLIFSSRFRLFALAGIYMMVNKKDYFAILTREPGFFFGKNGFDTEPILIHRQNFLKWYSRDYSSLLTGNFENDLQLEGFEISNEIEETNLNDKNLLQPISLKFSEIERMDIAKQQELLKSTPSRKQRYAQQSEERAKEKRNQS